MPKIWKKLFTLKDGELYWKQSSGRAAAGSKAGTAHGDGYRTVRVNGKAVYQQRIVKEMTTRKKIPKGMDVDHKDRDRSNNKPSNLKVFSRSDNNKNRAGWAAKPKPKARKKAKKK